MGLPNVHESPTNVPTRVVLPLFACAGEEENSEMRVAMFVASELEAQVSEVKSSELGESQLCRRKGE